MGSDEGKSSRRRRERRVEADSALLLVKEASPDAIQQAKRHKIDLCEYCAGCGLCTRTVLGVNIIDSRVAARGRNNGEIHSLSRVSLCCV